MSNGTRRFSKTCRHDRTGGISPPSTSRKPLSALGNGKKSYERYISLASAAASTGDVIEAENLYQHAEHYFRLMSEQAV